jgi:hypothetical protein
MMFRTLLCATALTLASLTSAHAQTEVAPPTTPDPQTDASATTDVAAPPVLDEGPPSTEPPPPSRDPDDIPLIDLSVLETDSLRLLYFDPTETYLTPYVARSFQNSLNFEQRIFGWEPWDQVTLLLKDFGDYGNAAARSSPNNALLIDIAPLSLAYETFSPGERFFTLTNHEVTHVALMDVWNERDARWRRIFGGKPARAPGIDPLQFSRRRALTCRAGFSKAAAFMETWPVVLAARRRHDEMVFRSMVRDDRTSTAGGFGSKASSSTPSRRTTSYGTRFSPISPSATPNKSCNGCGATKTARRITSRNSAKCSGCG